MQTPVIWEEIPEVTQLAEKLIEHFPEKFGGIKSEWIIGYGIANKDKPDGKKPWELSGQKAPMSFTNSKKYFFMVFLTDWEVRSDEARLVMIYAALKRIERDNPESGKTLPYDYKDQGELVRTFGPDWESKSRLPNLLNDDIEFVEEPQIL